MTYILNFIIFAISFIGMEAIAWLAHKYLMHGFLWHLHEDHHKKDHYGFFEKNDYFFLIFATPGIICILLGIAYNFNLALYTGLGITAYGLAYFIVHDVFIHQRIKWLRRTDSIYFRAIRKAHKVHHKKLTKEDGECFGMLFVPKKYFDEAEKALS